MVVWGCETWRGETTMPTCKLAQKKLSLQLGIALFISKQEFIWGASVTPFCLSGGNSCTLESARKPWHAEHAFVLSNFEREVCLPQAPLFCVSRQLCWSRDRLFFSDRVTVHCQALWRYFSSRRCAEVMYCETAVGKLGVLHPEVVANFDLTSPVAALELNLEKFYLWFKPLWRRRRVWYEVALLYSVQVALLGVVASAKRACWSKYLSLCDACWSKY